MATASPRMDELVKDYLFYRGFTGTLRTLESELRADKDKSLRTDKILEQIVYHVANHELNSLWDYWTALSSRFFSRLEQRYTSTVVRLEHNLLKLYVVSCQQNGRVDKVKEFFETMAFELSNQEDFKDWFAFPFLKNVEEHSSFATYFNKQWQDNFIISLGNFLSIIIQSMPAPILLNLEIEHRELKRLQEENVILKQKLQMAKVDVTALNSYNSNSEGGLELMDDFFVISGQKAANDTSNVTTSKNEKKFGFPFNPVSILGIKTHSSSENLTKKLNQNSGPEFNRKVPKTRSNEDKTPKKANVHLTQQPVALTSRNSYTLPQKSAAPDLPLNKPDEKSISSSLSMIKKPNDADRNRVPIAESLKDVKDVLMRKSAATKVPKSSTGFTSYISKSATSSAMPINQIDTLGPFLLLSQENYDEHSSSVTSVHFSTSSHYVASVDTDGIVKIWTWSPQPATHATVMSKSAFLSAAWTSKSDRHVLLGTRTGNIRLFDVRDSKTVCDAPADSTYPSIVQICCNPTGTQFVTAGVAEKSKWIPNDQHSSKSGRISIWELKTMKILSNLCISPAPISTTCMTFNHNGQLLLTGCSDGHIRLYDVNQCMCINDWPAHIGSVTALQFSSDETSCYSMGTDDKFFQWSMHCCGQQLTDLAIHSGACNPDTMSNKDSVLFPRGKLFSFDVEGKYILTCGSSGGIIYEVNNLSVSSVMDLKGHQSPVRALDWSPTDNRVCLTGSCDGQIKVSTFLSR